MYGKERNGCVKLVSLHDCLLPKLLRGEVRVKDVEV